MYCTESISYYNFISILINIVENYKYFFLCTSYFSESRNTICSHIALEAMTCVVLVLL